MADLDQEFAEFRTSCATAAGALVYPMFATDHEKEEWDGTVHG